MTCKNQECNCKKSEITCPSCGHTFENSKNQNGLTSYLKTEIYDVIKPIIEKKNELLKSSTEWEIVNKIYNILISYDNESFNQNDLDPLSKITKSFDF